MDLSQIYKTRFPETDLETKNRIWRVLCDDFFARFVGEADTVVDVGAGYCEFINNIRCRRKIAIDLNPDVKRFAGADVEVINESCTNMSSLAEGTADVVFMSNFLEHLPSKDLVYETLAEARRILRAGGRLIILQPNIRFLAREYWDFFDHHTPLSDRSLVEVLQSMEMR
ncbi:MAG: class I SAM-dependent methyltransferase, partial [Myxococcaceae bacterium]